MEGYLGRRIDRRGGGYLGRPAARAKSIPARTADRAASYSEVLCAEGERWVPGACIDPIACWDRTGRTLGVIPSSGLHSAPACPEGTVWSPGHCEPLPRDDSGGDAMSCRDVCRAKRALDFVECLSRYPALAPVRAPYCSWWADQLWRGCFQGCRSLGWP
jgi:hypothetical protein